MHYLSTRDTYIFLLVMDIRGGDLKSEAFIVQYERKLTMYVFITITEKRLLI
jgi:hypothetical protein